MSVLTAIALALSIQNATSTYTDLENCVEIPGEALVNQRCEGFEGWDIYTASSEHSAVIAFSDRGVESQFAQRPLRSGQFKNFSNRIEWRLADNGQAFATIQRWQSVAPVLDEATGAPTGEFERFGEQLVVSALRAEGTPGACHIAYIDATEVSHANELARIFADEWAPDAPCDGRPPFNVDASTAEFLFAPQDDSE